VIGELALTLVLLVGAGLLIKSFLRLLAVELGYDPKNLLTMMIPLDDAKYPPGSPQVKAFYREALTSVEAIPGVKAAATVSGLPLTGRPIGRSVAIEGHPPVPGWQNPIVEASEVSPDYFRAMGMRLLAGRGFTEQDDENAPRVIVINETLASRHFGGEYPIGKRILYGPLHNEVAHTIIGVASDVRRYGLEVEVFPEIYEPYLQNPQLPGFITLAVRTAGDPLNWANDVRQRIWAIEADQPIIKAMTMEQRRFRIRGAGVGYHRRLRRHFVFGQPARARDRHSDGLRRASWRCVANDGQSGNAIDADRRGAGSDVSFKPYISDREPTLQRQGDRSGDLCEHYFAPGHRRPHLHLHPGEKGDEGRSDDCSPVRMIVLQLTQNVCGVNDMAAGLIPRRPNRNR
jgi:hypothetical protein